MTFLICSLKMKLCSFLVRRLLNCWHDSGVMDQITVVRIDDSHIAQQQSDVGKVTYSMPVEEAAEQEEEDSVFIIEYSNPEEEGESYQFTMCVDRSHPVKKAIIKHPEVGDGSRALPQVTSSSHPAVRQTKKLVDEEELMVSNSVPERGEDYSNVMGSGNALQCWICPPPRRIFKKACGLAVHLRELHQVMEKKTFFCTHCKQTLRTQVQLDAHTRRHAKHDAVFTCHLCSANKPETTEYKRCGLRRHLTEEHPGIIPRCDICNKGFKSIVAYLADQFRHVGVTPYYCAKCQIYEMTERGLNIHLKNHHNPEPSEKTHLLTCDVSTSINNSTTDDSDF